MSDEYNRTIFIHSKMFSFSKYTIYQKPCEFPSDKIKLSSMLNDYEIFIAVWSELVTSKANSLLTIINQ